MIVHVHLHVHVRVHYCSITGVHEVAFYGTEGVFELTYRGAESVLELTHCGAEGVLELTYRGAEGVLERVAAESMDEAGFADAGVTDEDDLEEPLGRLARQIFLLSKRYR